MNTSIPNENHKSQGPSGWFPGKVLRFVTYLIAILTVISGYGASVNPAKFWYIAFTSLAFPILFMLSALLLVMWVFRKRKMFWVPLIAILLTSFNIPTLVQWNFFSQKPDFVEGQSEEIKFMSFNVRLFDLYNWSHNDETKAKIFNLFETEQPEILCIQEFYSAEIQKQQNVKAIMSILNFKSSHAEFPLTINKTDHYGIATLTKFPIVEKGVLYFDQKTANICIYTDISINTDTVRVYNCHLQSVRFGAKEYKFLESLGNDKEDEPSGEEAAARTRNILSRLKHAFVQRSQQVDLIAEHIRKSPHPVIICGDFNDTPTSYTYKTISEGLSDAFRESGRGFGTTYAGPIPGLRIDYILHSPVIESYDFRVGEQKLSDHFPVTATLTIKK